MNFKYKKIPVFFHLFEIHFLILGKPYSDIQNHFENEFY